MKVTHISIVQDKDFNLYVGKQVHLVTPKARAKSAAVLVVSYQQWFIISPSWLDFLPGSSSSVPTWSPSSAIPWSLSLSKSKFKISISIPDNPQGEFSQCHSPGAFCQGRVPSPHQSWGRNRIRTNSNFQCIKAGVHIKVVADVHSTIMDLFISSFYFAPLGNNALWWYLKMLVMNLMYLVWNSDANLLHTLSLFDKFGGKGWWPPYFLCTGIPSIARLL